MRRNGICCVLARNASGVSTEKLQPALSGRRSVEWVLNFLSDSRLAVWCARNASRFILFVWFFLYSELEKCQSHQRFLFLFIRATLLQKTSIRVQKKKWKIRCLRQISKVETRWEKKRAKTKQTTLSKKKDNQRTRRRRYWDGFQDFWAPYQYRARIAFFRYGSVKGDGSKRFWPAAIRCTRRRAPDFEPSLIDCSGRLYRQTLSIRGALGMNKSRAMFGERVLVSPVSRTNFSERGERRKNQKNRFLLLC